MPAPRNRPGFLPVGFSGPAALLITLMVCFSAQPAAAGEASLALGLTWDYGGYDVSGIDSGTGKTAEGGYYWAQGVGLFGCLHLAGYRSGGDADPIFWMAGEVRYRGSPGRDRAGLPWFWSAGVGGGIGYSGKPAVVTPIILELGFRAVKSGGVGIDLAVRNHAALFITGGDPPVDIVNSVELAISLVIGSLD
jgi:hypothetical protein